MEKYLKLIQSTDKSLKINNYEVNDIGADNLVIIVNNDLVFKFPKQEVFYERENNFLNYIRPYISANIPDTKIFNIDGEKFTCHKIIKGISYHELNYNERKGVAEELSTYLAKFFAELHSIKITNDFQKDNQHYFINQEQENTILNYYKNDKNMVNDFLNTKEYLKNYEKVEKDMCICHDDLHFGQIIINNNKPSGIIDFGDMVVCNYNKDFYQLCMRDFNAKFENNFDGLSKLTIEKYEKMSDKKVDLKYLKYRLLAKLYRYLAKGIIEKGKIDEEIVEKINICKKNNFIF